MVEFVKPNLLGTYKEFSHRFVIPITNGQFTDSSPTDIRKMKRRSYILHKLLDSSIQRKDVSILAPFLPPKQEYVVFISLTEIQCKLYEVSKYFGWMGYAVQENVSIKYITVEFFGSKRLRVCGTCMFYM